MFQFVPMRSLNQLKRVFLRRTPVRARSWMRSTSVWLFIFALALSLTACLKFNPEVLSLIPPSYFPYGYFSNFSGRESSSSVYQYQLKGTLDRNSSGSDLSTSGQYRLNSSPLVIEQATGKASGGSL